MLKWEWFPLSYVLWGLIGVWLVLVVVWLDSIFKVVERERLIERFYRHWSGKALLICAVFLAAGFIGGKVMVVDCLETQGYQLVLEEDGLFGRPDVIVEDYEERLWSFSILDCRVNHENKLIFLARNEKYDYDYPPETLEEIVGWGK